MFKNEHSCPLECVNSVARIIFAKPSYDIKFPIELMVDSIDQLTNNYYKIEGRVEKTSIPDVKEASISIFRESGGPLIVLHGLCRARFEKE